MALVANRYDLIDVIGSGGMATVWKARDTELGRIVALKRPHPAPPDSELHERFRREARIAATVSHPNLVTVFDAGADDDGPFLTMEYVEAPSLAETTITPDQARRVGQQIAAGLDALHRAGIVHRDVKPANVLFGPNGVQLTDFGIARAAHDTDELTQAGSTFATPAYAAPEVVEHGSHSAASDVYALGALLLEIVTGRRHVPNTDTQLLVTDPFWRSILEDTTGSDPELRPTAAELHDRLSQTPDDAGKATTVMNVAAAGPNATTSAPAVVDDDRVVTTALPMPNRELEPMERHRRRLTWLLGSAAVACVALLIVASLDGDDEPIQAVAATPTADPEPADETTATNVTTGDPDADLAGESTAATNPPAPATDEPTTTIEDPTIESLRQIAVAREELTSFIESIRDVSISARAADRLIDDLEDAVEAVVDDDRRSIETEIDQALRRIERDIDDTDHRATATLLLTDLVSALGIDVIES